MNNLLNLLVILILLMACSERELRQAINPKDLRLIKVDSIQIPYLGLLNLMDVHPATGQLLLFNQQAGKLVVGSIEGKVIREFSKSGDMPDSYGPFPLGAGKFSKDGKNFTIISNKGVYTYDPTGMLIHGNRHGVSRLPAFSGRASVDMEFFWVGDKILTAGHGRGEYPRNTLEFYENHRSLVWFDTVERKVEQFMHLDENSVFRNGKAHDIAHMSPKLAVGYEKIYIVQGIEPALNIHSLQSPYEKIRRVEFNIPDYTFNQGEDFNKADPRIINPDSYSGYFQNIKLTDQFVLISLFPGIPESERSKYEYLSWQDFLVKSRKAIPPRMLVLDLEGEHLTEIEIPAEFNERDWVYRDGFLWFLANINLEEEEDFVNVYKVQLGK